jgi:predicted nucleic acid-binding protein
MIQLPNAFNIHISRGLMHRLKETNTRGNIKLRSLDITNMYSNIPQKELIQVIDNALQSNNIPTEQKQETLLLINTILNQIYMQHNNNTNKKKDYLWEPPHHYYLQKYSCNT